MRPGSGTEPRSACWCSSPASGLPVFSHFWTTRSDLLRCPFTTKILSPQLAKPKTRATTRDVRACEPSNSLGEASNRVPTASAKRSGLRLARESRQFKPSASTGKVLPFTRYLPGRRYLATSDSETVNWINRTTGLTHKLREGGGRHGRKIFQ
jgi:hypothetical protein